MSKLKITHLIIPGTNICVNEIASSIKANIRTARNIFKFLLAKKFDSSQITKDRFRRGKNEATIPYRTKTTKSNAILLYWHNQSVVGNKDLGRYNKLFVKSS